MAKAVLCPVCNGSGELRDYEINPDSTSSVKVFRLKTCHGCGGKGWVEVSDSDYNPIKELGWDYPKWHHPNKEEDSCPLCGRLKCSTCGRLRSEPPLTGCPQGSHYVKVQE